MSSLSTIGIFHFSKLTPRLTLGAGDIFEFCISVYQYFSKFTSLSRSSHLRRSIRRQQVSLPILIELNMRQKKRRAGNIIFL